MLLTSFTSVLRTFSLAAISCADGTEDSLGDKQLSVVSNVENYFENSLVDLYFFILPSFFVGLLVSIVESIWRYLFEF